MKYFLTINGREREVEVVERNGGRELLLDGRSIEVDYCEVDQLGQVALRLGERTYAVSIEGQQNAFGVTVAGHFFDVHLEDERERAAHAAERAKGAFGGEVRAVMPGIVVELLVAAGDSVEEGQPLLTLEAMKMQNEIRSSGPGVVEGLQVSKGEAVAAGALLLTLRSA